MDDFFGDSKRCSESRRFDPIKRDEPRAPVLLGTVHDKVSLGFPGTHDFGTDSRITRRESSIFEVGPVTAHGGIKGLRTGLGHRVIRGFDPFHIRSKSCPTAEIECCVNAEPSVFWHRVDEPLKGRRAVEHIVATLGKPPRRNLIGWKPIDAARYGLGVESGRLAMASPTTPAPITTASACSTAVRPSRHFLTGCAESRRA